MMKEKYLVFSNSETGEIHEFFTDKDEAVDFFNQIIGEISEEIICGETSIDDFIDNDDEKIYMCKVIYETDFTVEVKPNIIYLENEIIGE